MHCHWCTPQIWIRRWVREKIWRISNLLKTFDVRTLLNLNVSFVTSLISTVRIAVEFCVLLAFGVYYLMFAILFVNHRLVFFKGSQYFCRWFWCDLFMSSWLHNFSCCGVNEYLSVICFTLSADISGIQHEVYIAPIRVQFSCLCHICVTQY